jgi:hypothetical protein
VVACSGVATSPTIWYAVSRMVKSAVATSPASGRVLAKHRDMQNQHIGTELWRGIDMQNQHIGTELLSLRRNGCYCCAGFRPIFLSGLPLRALLPIGSHQFLLARRAPALLLSPGGGPGWSRLFRHAIASLRGLWSARLHLLAFPAD